MSRRSLHVWPVAEQDLVEAREWYEKACTGLGDEFLAVAREGFALIQRSPELFAAGYCGVRQASIERFPYIIFFREVDENRLDVIGVLHGHRSSAVWRRRAREL